MAATAALRAAPANRDSRAPPKEPQPCRADWQHGRVGEQGSAV